MKRILLLGAHTAVAKSLVECFEERDIEVDLTRATTIDHIGEGMALIDEKALAPAELVVLAFRGEVAKKLAAAARKLGKPVLDLSGELAGEKDARFVFSGLDTEAGRAFDPARYAIVPLGLAEPIVAALRALAPFEPRRVAISTYESTAIGDQPGMDELSEQIRARFSMRDVEPHVFSESIAFGCIPSAGIGGESAIDADDALRRAIEAGIEAQLPELELAIVRVLVPTFSADSAVLFIDVDKEVTEEAIAEALKKAKGLHFLGDGTPSSLDAVGRDDALAGRVVIEGDRISLWIASDRLRRGSATLAALAIERWLGPR